MTLQIREIFQYRNEEFELIGEPLKTHIDNTNNPSIFLCNEDNCIRGYIGKWQISKSRLLIVDLYGDTNYGKANLKTLFPNEDLVFASWFSGTLRIFVGETKEYSKRGYFSNKEIFLTIENGELISSQLKQKTTDNKVGINLENYLNDLLISKIEKLNIVGLIDTLNIEINNLPAILQNQKYSELSKSVQKIDLEKWDSIDKEILFKSALQNLYIYFFIISRMNVPFPVASYNSIIEAITGSKFLYLNKKSIKWFNSFAKQILKKRNVEFEDVSKNQKSTQTYNNENYDAENWLQDASGTNDRETMNDVFWNLD